MSGIPPFAKQNDVSFYCLVQWKAGCQPSAENHIEEVRLVGVNEETSQIDGKDIEAMGIIQWIFNQPVHHGQLVMQILRETLKGRRNIAVLPESSAFCLSPIQLAWKREAQVDEDAPQ